MSSIYAWPLATERPAMSSRIGMRFPSSSSIVVVKGAPKEVLALCTHLCLQGDEQSLDETLRQQIMEVNDAYARNGLRVLAVAQRTLSGRGSPGQNGATQNSPFAGDAAEAIAQSQHRSGHGSILFSVLDSWLLGPMVGPAGKAICDLRFPSECVVAAVIRRGRLLIPHGNTILQAGDEVLAVVHAAHLVHLAAILGHSG
jgi:hypothetical protein